MWAVVGLGNPGRRYAGTRHNLGFMVTELLAERAGAHFTTDDSCMWALAPCAGTSVLLAKPQTYVNRSGRAVRALMARHQLELSDLLVVLDDIHLPFGRLRLRASGSAGGHNGLRSIEAELASTAYARLRIGVGAAPEGSAQWADHVLGRFEAAESAALPRVVEAAADAVECIITQGVHAAQAQINAPPSD